MSMGMEGLAVANLDSMEFSVEEDVERRLLSLGNYVRRERTKRGWTQSELGLRMLSDQSNVSKIEGGKTKEPTLATLLALANAFEVPLYRLLVDSELSDPDMGAEEPLRRWADMAIAEPELHVLVEAFYKDPYVMNLLHEIGDKGMTRYRFRDILSGASVFEAIAGVGAMYLGSFLGSFERGDTYDPDDPAQAANVEPEAPKKKRRRKKIDTAAEGPVPP